MNRGKMVIIKTKSMPQLLSEFPSAYFTQSGNLRDDSWPIWLSGSMFKYLGKKLVINEGGYDEVGNVWRSEWIETEEKTGKYAYRYVQFPGDGPEKVTYLYYSDPHIRNDLLTRVPERDL